MRVQHLRLGIIKRMLAWGAASGALLGALYPVLVVLLIQLLKTLFGSDAGSANLDMLAGWSFVGFFVGLILGCMAGLLIGLITGLALAALTYNVSNPNADPPRFRRLIELTCLLVGGLAALLLVLISGLPQYGAKGWGSEWSWLVWGVTPTLIATGATWWAGRHIAAWVNATSF